MESLVITSMATTCVPLCMESIVTVGLSQRCVASNFAGMNAIAIRDEITGCRFVIRGRWPHYSFISTSADHL